MEHSQWQKASETVYELHGELDRQTVPSLWRSLKLWSPSEADLELSLKNVRRIDSAGMVMIIHLLEHAKKQNCHIMLSFMPAQLITLIALSNVEPMLAAHIKN